MAESVNIRAQPLKAGIRSQFARADRGHSAAHKDEARVTTPDQFRTEMIGLLPRLRRFAMTLSRSGPDADDLVQDACAAALQKWHLYDPAQPLDRWMFRIIRNIWISEIRKRQVRQGQGQIPAEEATELQTADADEALAARQVQGKVSDLPAELAQPLMLVCAEGYSYLEVSALLEIPVGTVMSRIHRARKLLVSTLGQAERITS
ncbi:RNA polymerase sigma factor [Hoeflea sp.]|uniref:RNA polymerase sigma factor n=1 Tax=Hoeflea sp. TaxID=1940281 RepID=UPI0025BBE0C7|nr:RNA polymerase sigma factor [Hoeflea sp.]